MFSQHSQPLTFAWVILFIQTHLSWLGSFMYLQCPKILVAVVSPLAFCCSMIRHEKMAFWACIIFPTSIKQIIRDRKAPKFKTEIIFLLDTCWNSKP